MMKTCGHTMGTPKMDIFQAIEFFASIGHQGIEVRCAADGQLIPETYDSGWGKRVVEKARAAGIEIACLTPYYRDFVNPGKRAGELAAMRRVVDIAVELSCCRVRSYGGITPPASVGFEETWARTVSGLQEIGDYAAKKGVTICIETHGGSLTQSAVDTVKMAQAVGRANVGILFDYAWVDLAGQETAKDAVRLCGPYIRHCHVKDWRVLPGGERRTTLLGEGQLDWPLVLRALAEVGYDGYLSDEYEKYWQKYLPEPEVGMKHNAAYLREQLGR